MGGFPFPPLRAEGRAQAATPQTSAVDTLRGVIRPLRAEGRGTAPAPPPDTSALDTISEITGRIAPTLHTIAAPFGVAKRGVDALARAGARVQGVNVPDTTTVGNMARTAAGLDPGQGQFAGSYPGRLLGGATEIGVDLAEDPLSWILGSVGGTARAGATADAALASRALVPEAAAAAAKVAATGRTARTVGRVAAGALAPSMTAGAVQATADAARELRDNGMSPAAAEHAVAAVIEGLFAAGTLHHAASGYEPPATRAEGALLPEAPEAPVEAPVAAPPARPAPQPWTPEIRVPSDAGMEQAARDRLMGSVLERQRLQDQLAETDQRAAGGLPSERQAQAMQEQQATQAAQEQQARAEFDRKADPVAARLQQPRTPEQDRLDAILTDAVMSGAPHRQTPRIVRPGAEPAPQAAPLDVPETYGGARPEPSPFEHLIPEPQVQEMPIDTAERRGGERRVEQQPVEGFDRRTVNGQPSPDPRAVVREAQAAGVSPMKALVDAGLSPSKAARTIKELDRERSTSEQSSTSENASNGGRVHSKPARDVLHGDAAASKFDGHADIPRGGLDRAVGHDVPEFQGAPDRVVGHAIPNREFANRPAGSTKVDRLVDGPSSSGMLPTVLGAGHDGKVGDGVVEPVPVDVVNDLGVKQGAAKRTLHDDSVLKPLSATVVDQPVRSSAVGVLPDVAVDALHGKSVTRSPSSLGPARSQAVDATLQQMSTRLRHAEAPTRVPVRGKNGIETKVPVAGARAELGLEDIDAGTTKGGKQRELSNDQLAAEIDKDANNPVYLQAKEAAERHDPFGYLAAAEEQPSEHRVSEDRRGEQRREPDRRQMAEELSVKHNLPPEHPLIQEHVEEKFAHAATKNDAMTDPLTGVPGGRAHRDAMANGEHGAWVSMDVGGVKRVNDIHGHKAGDEFIRQVTQLAEHAAATKGGKLYRPHEGGDELAIGARDEAHAHEIAKWVKHVVAKAPIDYLVDGKVVDTFEGTRVDFGYAGGGDAAAFGRADQFLKAYRTRAEALPEGHPEKRHPYRIVERGPVRGVAPEAPAGRDVPDQADDVALPPTGSDPKYAVRRPPPGQRGLPDIAEDVAPAREKKSAPEQQDLFGAKDMLVPSEARVTEGREGDGPLFTQERDQALRDESKKQGSLFSDKRAKREADERLLAADPDTLSRDENYLRLKLMESRGEDVDWSEDKTLSDEDWTDAHITRLSEVGPNDPPYEVVTRDGIRDDQRFFTEEGARSALDRWRRENAEMLAREDARRPRPKGVPDRPRFRRAQQAAGTPTLDLVRQRFGGIGKVAELEPGVYEVSFQDGLGKLIIRGVDKITATGADAEALKKAHPDSAGAQILGVTRSIGKDVLVDVVEGNIDLATLGHEEFHGILQQGRLRPDEVDALFRQHGFKPGDGDDAFARAEERVADTIGRKIADAVKDPASISAQAPWFRRFWSYLKRLYGAFQEGRKGPTAEGVGEKIASGEVYRPEGLGERGARAVGGAVGDRRARPIPPWAKPGFAVDDAPRPKMSHEERQAEIARLRSENRDALATPLMSEGGVSPAQLGRMSARQREQYSERGQRRMLVEAKIRDLSRSDDVIVKEERGAAEKTLAEHVERLRRSAKNLRDLAARGMSSKKFLRAADEIDGQIAALQADGPKYATAPAEVPKTARTGGDMGRPMKPGEAPRVDQKVEDYEAALEHMPEAARRKMRALSRDAPRTWKGLDPAVKDKIADLYTDGVVKHGKNKGQPITADQKEADFLEHYRSGQGNDVDTMVMDALQRSKREAADTTRQEYLRAQGDGAKGVEYLKAAMDAAVTDYAKAARADVEGGTKLARALAARARVMNAAAVGDPDKVFRMILRQIPDVSDAQASKIADALKNSPSELQDLLHAALKPSTLDKWLEWWKAGLVSAPGTQVANVAGNVGEQSVRVGETAIGGVLDRMMGGPRVRVSGEAGWEMAGLVAGARRGAGPLARSLRDIATLAPEKIDLTRPLEYQTGKIGGKKGRFIRAPFRLLGAFDDFFKTTGGEAELYKQALRFAKGDKSAAARLLERDEYGVPRLLHEQADIAKAHAANVKERVFQDPQKMADVANNARSRIKLLHLLLPFTGTPTSIAARTLERSPYGFVEGVKAYRAFRSAVSSGADAETVARLKGVAVDKLARPIVGTMILGTFAGVAQAGGMTGGGPTDPKDRNALRDGGWQPYSFVITAPGGKKTYIPFNRFEPVSSILGFAADMVESKDQQTAQGLVEKGLASIAQNLTSKTYLQGLADAAELLHDPNMAEKYIANLAGSAVPNIVNKAAQAIDPAVRETRPSKGGFASLPERAGKTIQSRIPYASERLAARRSGTGEPIVRPGTAATRFASPVQPSTENEGMPFQKLLVDLDAVPSAPKKEVNFKARGHKVTVKLTDDEYASLQAEDERTTERLRRATASSGFLQLDEESQRNYVRSQYEQGRQHARSRLLARSSLRARATGP